MTFQDFECVMVLKNHEWVHVKHGKCIFVPQGEYSCILTENLGLIMQKYSQVVQKIIRLKSFQIICRFKRGVEKYFGSGNQITVFFVPQVAYILNPPKNICYV